MSLIGRPKKGFNVIAYNAQKAHHMTRRIPSAREMEASRKVFYFRDDEDTRTAVCVELQPDGLWAAGLEDDPEAGWAGSGETVLEAIADLRDQMAREG